MNQRTQITSEVVQTATVVDLRTWAHDYVREVITLRQRRVVAAMDTRTLPKAG